MGTPLGPKYIPYTYMDPLGWRLAQALLLSFCWLLIAPLLDICRKFTTWVGLGLGCKA